MESRVGTREVTRGISTVDASSMSRGDRVIQVAADIELNWTPELETEDVQVQVANGVVTLTGVVGDELGYLACGRAIRRVSGVLELRNNVTVQPCVITRDTHADLAGDVTQALVWAAGVPRAVKAHVRSGHVTLTGQVEWTFQRDAAQHVIGHVAGVESVDNQIAIRPRTPRTIDEERIGRALLRNPLIDASDVNVTIIDTTATLTGWVWSLAEKKQAGLTTGASPCVTHIDNRLRIRSRGVTGLSAKSTTPPEANQMAIKP